MKSLNNISPQSITAKILIVDDTPKNIQILASVLSSKGYQLGYAQNGKQALEIVRKTAFDLILLDVMMPEMDGFEVCELLKQDEYTNEIPVIFLTAKTDEQSIIRGFQVGGIDYLTKPFNAEELLIRVQTHLQAGLFKRQLIETNERLQSEIKSREEAELKLSIVAKETINGVIIFDNKGLLEWHNVSMKSIYEGTNVENKLIPGTHLFEISENPEITNYFNYCLATGKSKIYETQTITDKGIMKWLQTTMTPIFGSNNVFGKLITIDTDITSIKKAEAEIHAKNIKITDSIQYALRIQNAILPKSGKLEELFPSSFVLLRAKDIVSGDFFWYNETDEKWYIAAVDCTGHGVPGAFMSIIANNMLNKILLLNKITQPALMLDQLDLQIKESLRNSEAGDVKDGMDIALISIDKSMKYLDFAGAYNSLWIIRNGELLEFKADNSPIGDKFLKDNMGFTNHKIDLQKGDRLYIFSDGYVSQFGGDLQRKYLKKNLKAFLLSIVDVPINEQKAKLERNFKEWQGNIEQIDDVLIVGIEI